MGPRELVHIKYDCVYCFLPMQASLVSALQAPDGVKVAPLVFFHFSGARPDQGLALTLLRRLCAYLHSQLQEPSALPSTYRCVSTISPAFLMPHDTTSYPLLLLLPLTLVLPLHTQGPGVAPAAEAVAQVCSVPAIWPDPGPDRRRG